VCVSVDARREWARKDAIGEMVRKTQCVTMTASGKTSVITADGKKLGDVMWINERLRMNSLKKILAAWEALPEEERKPGRKVDYGPPDPNRPLVRPPEGTLILAGQFRRFMRNPDGTLRYTEQADYNPGEGQNGWQRLREPAQDMMWIPEKEWRALIPESPQKGQSMPAPPSFVARLARYRLDPERGLGESVKFLNVQPRLAEFTITVDEVSEKELRLRLTGQFDLAVREANKEIAYAPAILGFVTYDRQARRITRFDLLAFGEANNSPRGLITGKYWLGIVYELVEKPTEAQLVWPRGARDGLAQYLDPRPLVKASK
jgi:hypothetical protein